MPQSITLGSSTFTAARLRRTGGRLSYNDDLIPTGAEVIMAHAMSGVASLVLADGRLMPVYVREITDETFEFVAEIPARDAQRTVLTGARHEVIAGSPMTVSQNTIVRRTDRPFTSMHEHYAPHDDELTVHSVHSDSVWFDTSDFVHGSFRARYLTDAYFEVVQP
jgi:hypothetical protein